MDNSHKDKIVGAYYAAAEAMAALKANVRGAATKNVLPFVHGDTLPAPANQINPDTAAAEQDSCSSTFEASDPAAVTSPALIDPATDATSALIARNVTAPNHPSHEICETPSGASSLVYWEDIDKHQWLLDVLSDLEVYAQENSLAETAEALVAARCELLSHTGTSG